MKTFNQIRQVVDNHAQMRQNSCFQSAVEMVLKLYDILPIDAYPEQAFANLDGVAGFAHYVQLGQKTYNGTTVTFAEEKFDANQPPNWKTAAWQRGVALLAQDVYPIFSLARPGGGFHGHIAIPDAADHMQFITRETLGLGADAEIQGRQGRWQIQTKAEILIVRPV